MEQGVWRPPIDAAGLDKNLTEIDEAAVFYGQFYGYGRRRRLYELQSAIIFCFTDFINYMRK